MTYAIRLHAKIADDLNSIPASSRARIFSSIRSLADNPRPQGIKKLSNIKSGVKNAYRLRVGNYRIGYQIFDRELIVSVIVAAERGTIYPLLKRRLKY